GHCKIYMEPLEPGSGYVFEDKTVGGSIPKEYIPAIDAGIREAKMSGILGGYECVDFKVTVYDGSYHDVDSNEVSFKMAASIAFKKGIAEANPVLLEPIMRVEVSIPDEYMGDVMGDMNKRRGRILGMDQQPGGGQLIMAEAPQAEMFEYAIDLRAMTQGRGAFTMEFERYEEVPAQIAEEIIESRKE
ncbi:MAG: elongation factor G, partial [Peptoniphilus sp.]|nr:elongation factor G [Peptoniphilus sp.]